MREIKFRAWDTELKKMFSNANFFIGAYGQACLLDKQWLGELVAKGYVQNGNHNKKIIMQYTGLKDKNGKDIYEGDILLVEDYWHEAILDDGSGPDETLNHLANVEFFEGAFGVNIHEKAYLFDKGFLSFPHLVDEIGADIKQLEVIGNIYENPELTEAK